MTQPVLLISVCAIALLCSLTLRLFGKGLDSRQGWLAEAAWAVLARLRTGGRRGLLTSWFVVYLATVAPPLLFVAGLWALGAHPIRVAGWAALVIVGVGTGVLLEASSTPNPTARIENAQRRARELLTQLEVEARLPGTPVASPSPLSPAEQAAIAAKTPTPAYRAHLVRLARAIPKANAALGWTRLAALEFVAEETRRVDEAQEAAALRPPQDPSLSNQRMDQTGFGG